MNVHPSTLPAVILAQRFPIERVATCIVLVWGIVMMSTAGCTNYQGFFAQRFFLGMIESGVSPMFMLIVAGFYKKHEQAVRMGIWYCSSQFTNHLNRCVVLTGHILAGYASVFSPLINYGLGHITGGMLSPWQYSMLPAP